MLVTNKNVQDVMQSYARTGQVQSERTGSAATARQAAPQKRDAIQLSAETLELQKALAVLKASPEVRQDLVAALKRDIAAGNFNVNLDEVSSQLSLVI